MYEYSIIFNNNVGRFSILVKSAASSEEAIKVGIEEVTERQIAFYSVECVTNI